MKTEEPTNIGFMYIEPGGVVGMHKAPVPQLFIVIQGEGWVCGEDQEKVFIKLEKVFFGKQAKHMNLAVIQG